MGAGGGTPLSKVTRDGWSAFALDRGTPIQVKRSPHTHTAKQGLLAPPGSVTSSSGGRGGIRQDQTGKEVHVAMGNSRTGRGDRISGGDNHSNRLNVTGAG